MDITSKGAEIYRQIYPRIKGYEGYYVAIEVETGKYFVERELVSVLKKAKAHFPDKIFYTQQIGKEGVAEFR